MTSTYIFVDVNSRGCLEPSIQKYTWNYDINSKTYIMTQGDKKVEYSILLSEDVNRMNWSDLSTGVETIWDRIK